MSTDHVAVSDCERVRPGIVAQPVNSASSLAFCGVGGWIWAHAGRSRRPGLWRAVAAITALVGFGSAAYHGPGRAAGRALHDGSNLALLPALTAAIALNGPPRRPALDVLAAGLGASGLVVHRLSRTGGPLCRPESPVQGHAVWHGLAAASLLSVAAAHLAPATALPADRETT